MSEVYYWIFWVLLFFANIVTVNRHKIVMPIESGPLYLESRPHLCSFERPPDKINSVICNSCLSEECWSKSGSSRDFKQQSQERLVSKDLSLVARYQPPCSDKDPIISVQVL